MFLVDSHCHLGDLSFGGKELVLKDVLASAAQAGVTHMLCVCTDLPSFPGMYGKIEELGNVFASVGVHPLNIDTEWDEGLFREYATRKKIVAVGEIGLDYHYEEHSRRQQQEIFARQLELALELDLPLIIHSREAPEDTWAVLEECDPAHRLRGVFHCYADGIDHARKVLDRGFHISVSGIVTFGRAENIRELAAFLPLDRLLVETDSPYLAPVPFRGKPNQPAYVEKVARAVAAVRNTTFEEICDATSANFQSLFRVTLA